jgi:serine/threonine-protein kinase
MVDGSEVPSQTNQGVREGDLIAGKVRIAKVLGMGGMGVVVAAHHLQLDEYVAIKFLLPQALTHGEVVVDRACRGYRSSRGDV